MNDLTQLVRSFLPRCSPPPRVAAPLLAVPVLMVAACSSVDPGSATADPESQTQPILDGHLVRNSSYPSIGKVTSTMGAGSGTLIDSTHVLAAAHTVEDVVANPALMQYCSFYLWPDGAGTTPTKYSVKSVRVHPSYQWYMNDPLRNRIMHQDPWRPASLYDVAVLELTAPITNGTPMPLSTGDPVAGASVMMLGYGDISTNGGMPTEPGNGQLYMGNNTISAADSTYLYTRFTQGTQAPYFGDSGGPLWSGGIVGVVNA